MVFSCFKLDFSCFNLVFNLIKLPLKRCSAVHGRDVPVISMSTQEIVTREQCRSSDFGGAPMLDDATSEVQNKHGRGKIDLFCCILCGRGAQVDRYNNS